METAATPAAAPPAIAPTFEFLLVDSGEEEEGEVGRGEVTEGLGTAREPVVPELAEELVEMAEPGGNSGVSK